MKKIIVLLTLLLSSSLQIFSQRVIEMEENNGVYKIPCFVNGAKMKMIFDTGASAVSLSKSMADFLYDNDYISSEDILGSGQTRTADGSIHDNIIINIKDIEISGLHLKNVQAVVLSSQNAPLLLGQTAIQKLGSITIDGNCLIVNDAVGSISDEELDEMWNELYYFLQNDSYRAALDVLEKIEMGRGLDSYGFRKKAFCLTQLGENKECINTCLRWNRYSGTDKTIDDKGACYTWLCESYANLEQYSEAIKWGEKAVLVSKDNLVRLPWDYLNLCHCYLSQERYSSAINYGKQAITTQLKKLKTTSSNVLKGLVNDDDLNWMYYTLALCYLYSNDNYNGVECMVHSAMMGRLSAIKYCVNNNINYKEKAQQMLRRY